MSVVTCVILYKLNICINDTCIYLLHVRCPAGPFQSFLIVIHNKLSKYVEFEHKPQEYLNLCMMSLASNSDIFSRSTELNLCGLPVIYGKKG